MAHRETDFVPFQMDCLAAAERKLKGHFGECDLSEVIGNHMAMFEPSYYSIFIDHYIDERKFVDAFGATWELKPNEDIGTVIDNPLKAPSLKGYSFPVAARIMDLENIPAFIESNKDRFVVGAIGFSLYERAWIMRGIEPLLSDFLSNPGFVEELFDKIIEFNLEITRKLCTYPVDAFHYGDDWGQQYGLIMGMEL